ncbi:MAG TPA: NAD(P)H-dependent oxidoreductase, partial [Flavobacteriales bacterium]|nr:NAD(P)H-dependent oxidoreductase [Flavobacteriales bacterium]
MKKVFVLNGSTRAASANKLIVQAIMNMAGDRARFTLYPSVADLPHFNPDLDTDAPPKAVTHFRELLKSSDAVLICTPEYAMGV